MVDGEGSTYTSSKQGAIVLVHNSPFQIRNNYLGMDDSLPPELSQLSRLLEHNLQFIATGSKDIQNTALLATQSLFNQCKFYRFLYANSGRPCFLHSITFRGGFGTTRQPTHIVAMSFRRPPD